MGNGTWIPFLPEILFLAFSSFYVSFSSFSDIVSLFSPIQQPGKQLATKNRDEKLPFAQQTALSQK
jgi:hypothetical protein